MDLDDHWATVTDWREHRATELPDWAIAIIFILEAIMDEQGQINADTSAINDGLSAIEAEVAALKAQPAAAQLDLSKLDAVVSRVRGDVAAPAAPPVAEPPAPAQQPAGTPAQPTQAPAATPAQPAAAATTPVATDVNGAPVQPPAPGEAPAPAKSRYLYSGDTSAINSGEWPKAGATPDGAQLYTYSGDTAPGDAKGAGGGWTLYAELPHPPALGEAPAPVHQAPAVNGGIGGATTPPSQSAPPQVQSAPPATQ